MLVEPASWHMLLILLIKEWMVWKNCSSPLYFLNPNWKWGMWQFGVGICSFFSLFLVNRSSVHRVKKRKQWSTNENKQSTGLAFASGKTNTSDSKFYTVKRHTVTISQTQSVVFTKPFDKDLDIYHKKIFSAKRNSVNKHIFEIN